ncbi:EboA domain-containing protein [Sphingobacterium sp. HJSM2_6]|uniref:EboA domain-containing protein n=1 Tax=Sphingobacterium sp. HJSM2_6 TaxID=3366264 RepID=UPI003BD04935
MNLNSKVIAQLIQSVNAEERDYLNTCEKQIKEQYKTHFVRIFSTLSRKLSLSTKEKLIQMQVSDSENLIIEDWTVLRLARVYLLSLIQDEEESYVQFINQLFDYADMQELVALYSALNVLDYPSRWIERCKEGIRNNIGLVQEAIIEQNKFPSEHLNEEAWNQMVLKSFFTSKNVLKIAGLFERNNPNLATAIVDYIYERHSAKRNIHPILWLLAKNNLPERALSILSEQFHNCSDSLEGSILFYILEENNVKSVEKEQLTSLNQELALIPFSEDLLERFKNRNVCVQI